MVYIADAAELPDAMEIIYQKALEVGTRGAVSKLTCTSAAILLFRITFLILLSDCTIFDQLDSDLCFSR